jgi:drug/metabolite transporter (DMT)-like permease
LFAVAAAGIVLVYLDKEFSFSNRDFAGMAAMLVSALATAVFMVVFKKSTERYSNPELIFHQNIVGAAIFLPFLFIDMPALNIVRLGTVTFYSLLVGVIGFALYFPALKKAKVSTVSFLAYFEPVSAILFAAILLGEGITWNMAAGGLLIIGSAILLKKD